MGVKSPTIRREEPKLDDKMAGFSTREGIAFAQWETTKAFGEEVRVVFSPAFKEGRFHEHRGLTPSEAKSLRELDGKKVQVVSSIREAKCLFTTLAIADAPKKNGRPKEASPEIVVEAVLNPLILDGFLPASWKHFYK